MTDQTLTATASAIHTPRGLAEDLFRLDDRVALITGGSKNIGMEIAAAFVQAGAKVVIVGRKEGQLAEAKAGLEALPRATGTIETVAADISEPEGPEQIANFVQERYGFIDILVNNAHSTGDTRDVEFTDIPRSTWQKVFDTNLFGPIELVNRLVDPILKADRQVSIINLIALAAFQTAAGIPAYSTSKSALWMYTRYLAHHLGKNVRSNAISPGFITETGMARYAYGQKIIENGGVPLGRVGRPEEVAPAALYLASDASSYVSDAVLHVSGGRPW